MDSWQRIIGIVVENLPRDVHFRCEVVDALRAVVPPSHPHANAIHQMSTDLRAHLLRQRDLHFDTLGNSPRGSSRQADKRVPR